MCRKVELLDKRMMLGVVVTQIVPQMVQFQQFHQHQIKVNLFDGGNLRSVQPSPCHLIDFITVQHQVGCESVMQQLIEDCKAGKIDLVLTKSIARFARNIVDCLSVIELLKNLNPPVGVKFEADNIYTLDSNGRMILTILASVAEEESHSKSIIMNWSIDRRFSRGLFLTPALLGYDKDEEGNLVINPEEAQTVKVIYYLYLNGYSLTEIATLLMEYPNAIRWGRLKEGRWCASTLGCRGLAKALFDIMEWDEDLRYRFRGQFLEQGDNKMMLFAFDEPEMIKVEEIVLPPKENTEEDEGETVRKKIYIFPPEWAGTFGQPITSIAQVGILRQEHYAGNWDVFRPASEIEEMNTFTAESLNKLLHEAEKIMEGWTDYR